MPRLTQSISQLVKRNLGWLTLCWAIAMLILHGIPGHRLPKVGFMEALKPDKLLHLFMFWILATLWLLAKSQVKGIPKAPYRTLVVISCITYGLCLEFSQFYIFENRSFDPWDWLADTLGATVALMTFNSVHSTVIN